MVLGLPGFLPPWGGDWSPAGPTGDDQRLEASGRDSRKLSAEWQAETELRPWPVVEMRVLDALDTNEIEASDVCLWSTRNGVPWQPTAHTERPRSEYLV